MFTLSLFLIFFSCKQSSKSDNEVSDLDDCIYVTFINKSSYEVNVYAYANPSSGKEKDISVTPNSEGKIKLHASHSEMGDSFYFEYLVPVGNMKFPYFSYNNSKIYRVEAKKENKITIDELVSCPTNYSYLVLANKTTSSISLLNGNNYEAVYAGVSDENQSVKEFNIQPQNEGIYLLGKDDNSIFYQAKNLAVGINGERIDFPQVEYSLGNIYTFEALNTSVELKSIMPFDVDTDRKIWSIQNTGFLCNSAVKPLIRESNSLEKGSIICGTIPNKNDYVGMQRLNQYGQLSEISSVKIGLGNSEEVDFSCVLDFLEEDDGSVVLLLQNEILENEQNKVRQILCSYDFENRKLNWSFIFDGEYAFNLSSRNKIIKTEDGRICLAGGIVKDNVMGLWFGAYNPSDRSFKTVVSGYGSDISQNIETMFTSIYYDGNDFYVCGFMNCDYKYSDVIHKGIIYTINNDLSNSSKIYEHDKVLFFSIDGNNNGFYACGEYEDTGKILKGCLISSEMITNNMKLQTYTGINSYCWFNQVYINDNKVFLMGISSESTDGEGVLNPLLITVKNDGTELWRNEDFGFYNKPVAIIPNSIGTYVLELYNSRNQKIKYSSVDMLGNVK